MKPLLGDENVDALRQSCFFANSFPMAGQPAIPYRRAP
jgi:hypothetical protein